MFREAINSHGCFNVSFQCYFNTIWPREYKIIHPLIFWQYDPNELWYNQ